MKILSKIYLVAIAIFFTTNLSWAQFLRGTVLNERGETLSNVSIFIRENSESVCTNEDGKFSIAFNKNQYTCDIQHFLYAKKTVNFTSTDSVIKIILSPKYYNNDTIISTQYGENIAFPIMRQVIARVPIFENIAREYTAQKYIRGNFKVSAIEKITKTIGSGYFKGLNIKDGDIFFEELQVEETLKKCRKSQRITNSENNFPDKIKPSELVVRTIDIYDTDSDWFVSPLSTRALSEYNFVYGGKFVEQNKVVYRIYVIPITENTQLVSGSINIFADTWNVHSFELSMKSLKLRGTVTQIFAEVQQNIRMPINTFLSANMFFDRSLVEISAISTAKYGNIKAGYSSLQNLLSWTMKRDIKQQKYDDRIQKLMIKSDISDRDAINASKIIDKLLDEKDSYRKLSKYEIFDNFLLPRTDSLSKKSDIEYRPVLLSDKEFEHAYTADTTALKKYRAKQKSNEWMAKTLRLALGGEYELKKNATLHYSGILGDKAFFNAVDRFVPRQALMLDKSLRNGKSYQLSGDIAYSFGRKKLLYELGFNFVYLPKKRAAAYVKFVNNTVDFNEDGGVNLFTNTFSSLLFKKNYVNFYGKKVLSLGHTIDIANGLSFAVDLSVQHRKQLYNTTNFSFFGNNSDYRPNEPVNPYIESDSTFLQNNKATVLTTSLSYTPCQFYRIINGRKILAYSHFPTFALIWQRSAKGVADSDSNFDKLTFKVSQKISFGVDQAINYQAKIGKFFKKKNMHFSEFEHFNLSEDDLFFSPLDGLQKLMQTYYSSTNDWFVHANFEYRTPRLLLNKYVFRKIFMYENLYFSYLNTPHVKHFSEIGYGVSRILGFVGVGVFLGFRDYEYEFVRVKFSIDI